MLHGRRGGVSERAVDGDIRRGDGYRPAADLSREELMDKVEHFNQKFADAPPRPNHWGGFRIRPIEMEFWAGGDYRLHDRFRWSRANINDNWLITRLSP